MKKLIAVSIVVAVALAGVAFAADTAAPAAKTPAAAAEKAPAAKAPEGVKATVKGKVASKMVKRQDKDIKVFEITVTEAKGADGKAIGDLKDKALHLGPRDKVAEFEKFDGKNVEITGTVAEGRRAGTKMLRVDSIK